MSRVTYVERSLFEKYSEKIGFVCSIEDWARKHRLNVYVAVYEHKEIKDPIVAEIKTKAASTVLDVGCGYGFLMSSVNAACPNTTVVGTDISKYQIANAKLRGINEPLVVCCAEYMPFKSDFFDFIVCSEVIEHVANPEFSLLEMERMIRKDGHLCISTDNPLSVFRRISRLISGIISLKKSVKEEYIPLNALERMIPHTVRIYKVRNICPYPLLPMLGPFGSRIFGRSWVSLGEVAEKIPYLGKHFCNKYIVFGIRAADP